MSMAYSMAHSTLFVSEQAKAHSDAESVKRFSNCRPAHANTVTALPAHATSVHV
jgi:hypothetical protein